MINSFRISVSNSKIHVLVLATLLFGFQFSWANSLDTEIFPASESSPNITLVSELNSQSVSISGSESVQTLSGIGIGEEAYTSSNNSQVSSNYDSMYLTLAAMVGVLILVVLLLIFVAANMVNLNRIREGDEAFSMKGTFVKAKELAMNPAIALTGGFFSMIIGMFFIVPMARGVGFSQGYQPDQPIWFSHAIHAGENEIDCQYCHSGASKGKNAWIPSVNVCMNCHKAITEGPVTGTKEIAKIHNAYNNDIPIEWVRIHNLPDLAYFNHQQHVVAGEQECETCHGPISEMDVVYQFAPLSMGWCLNCHRETEVNSDLYKILGRDDVHTVQDIGGFDCARCHY